MKKRDRVMKALAIEEPDVVPITEIDMEVPIMEAIIGERLQVATSLQTPIVADRRLERKRSDFKIGCYRKIGFDVLTIDLSPPEDWTPQKNPDGTIVDLWGRILMLDVEAKAWVPYGTIFNQPEDFDVFESPNPNALGWAYASEYAKKMIGDEMALATFIRDPFAHAWELSLIHISEPTRPY